MSAPEVIAAADEELASIAPAKGVDAAWPSDERVMPRIGRVRTGMTIMGLSTAIDLVVVRRAEDLGTIEALEPASIVAEVMSQLGELSGRTCIHSHEGMIGVRHRRSPAGSSSRQVCVIFLATTAVLLSAEQVSSDTHPSVL
jgi:hypothetical protein